MKIIPFLILGVLTALIFKSWFTFLNLGGRDLPYFYPERLKEFGLMPEAWANIAGNGLGENSIRYIWTDRYLQTAVSLFSKFAPLDYQLILRIFYLWPLIFLLLFLPWYFLKKIYSDRESDRFIFFGVLTYSFNTFVLMLISGGQLNLAIAYTIIPFAVLIFREFLKKLKQLTSAQITGVAIKFGLVVSIQLLFDLRIAYITFVLVVSYFIYSVLTREVILKLKNLIEFGTVAGIVLLLLNAYWLFPQLLSDSAFVPKDFDDPNWLTFLSWSKFSTSLALLHPNWPENIFGKTYFLRAEFLFIPLLAFSALFFWQKDGLKNKKEILFFALIGLAGVFLSKGVNPPFGEVYRFLFTFLPGFSAFRDPIKWFSLTALSYSVLIPLAIKNIAKKIPSGFVAAVLIFSTYWVFLLKPLLLFKQNSSLRVEERHTEYDRLAEFISGQKSFFRTLWIPVAVKYSPNSNEHPLISANYFFQSTDPEEILKRYLSSEKSAVLDELAVKYLILPYDYGEKYKTVRDVLKGLQNQGFKKVAGFEKVLVLQRPKANGLFSFFTSTHGEVRIGKAKANRYELNIARVKKGDRLLFSQSYDRNWTAKIESNGEIIRSGIYNNLNSFLLPKAGNYKLVIEYKLQKWVHLGMVISLLTFTTIIVYYLITLYNTIYQKVRNK